MTRDSRYNYSRHLPALSCCPVTATDGRLIYGPVYANGPRPRVQFPPRISLRYTGDVVDDWRKGNGHQHVTWPQRVDVIAFSQGKPDFLSWLLLLLRGWSWTGHDAYSRGTHGFATYARRGANANVRAETIAFYVRCVFAGKAFQLVFTSCAARHEVYV